MQVRFALGALFQEALNVFDAVQELAPASDFFVLLFLVHSVVVLVLSQRKEVQR